MRRVARSEKAASGSATPLHSYNFRTSRLAASANSAEDRRQRVALARALVYEPRILLLDEPLSALDRRLRETMQLELTRIHRELGVTIVNVTHDQREALLVSDRIAVMERGRVVQCGPGRELYARPATTFVAGFLGDPLLLEGIVTSSSGVQTLTGSGVTLVVPPSAPVGRAVAVLRPERLRLLGVHGDVSAYDNGLHGTVMFSVLRRQRDLLPGETRLWSYRLSAHPGSGGRSTA